MGETKWHIPEGPSMEKTLNAIENVLRDAEDKGYNEPMAGWMFVTFEMPDDEDPKVKWQFSITGWGLLKELLLRNEHISMRRSKMVKTGESKYDWEEDESESGSMWVDAEEVMRRLSDEDYWLS